MVHLDMSVEDGLNMEESADSSNGNGTDGGQSRGEKWVESEVVSLITCQMASNVSLPSSLFNFAHF